MSRLVIAYLIAVIVAWGYLLAWAYNALPDALMAAVLVGWFFALAWPILLTAHFWNAVVTF